VLVFHEENNWLCWKFTINYEARSVIFWDFTQHGMVILTTNVLMTLEDGFPEMSVANEQYMLRNIPGDLKISM
jgi:hypothetical protein